MVVLQSLAQLVLVSPASQVPLPHTGLEEPQSLLQLVLVSPLSHLPLPHTGPPVGQGLGHWALLEQVTIPITALLDSMPPAHSWIQPSSH